MSRRVQKTTVTKTTTTTKGGSFDPKNYEKFNEITKSNIDLNFGKEI